MSKRFKSFQSTVLGTCLTLALSTGVMSTAANADTADEIRAAQAVKISIRQAVDVALREVSGDLIGAEFDDNDSDSTSGGGVYELKFTDGKAEYEVKVDAITARIVDIDTDSLDDSDMNDYNLQRRAKIGIMAVINTIEDQVGSHVLEIEFKNNRNYNQHPSYYEVDMLRENQIIELKIDADTGREFERNVKR